MIKKYFYPGIKMQKSPATQFMAKISKRITYIKVPTQRLQKSKQLQMRLVILCYLNLKRFMTLRMV